MAAKLGQSKPRGPFSDMEVRRLSEPGYFLDADGLYLQVTKNAGGEVFKSWIFKYMIAGRRREMGCGSYPAVPLAGSFKSERDDTGNLVRVYYPGARDKAKKARAMLDDGIDPIEERNGRVQANRLAASKRAVTIRECAEAYIEAHRSGWRNSKHADQWASTLETFVYPFTSLTKPKKGEPAKGDMPVAAVTREHVLAALRPIWTTKTETATRVRSRIELVLNFAMQAGHRPEAVNPARWRGGLDALLPKPTRVKKVQHHAALPVNAVAEFMFALRQQAGMGARALEFLTLTATRSGDVRGATWSEFDLDAGVWVIPAERLKVKGSEDHRVPLSTQAVRLLKAMPRTDSPLVFPAARGGTLSDMTLSAVMRRMKANAVPHGMRSTFRDWAGDHTSFPRELVEHALAHRVGNAVEQAYRRGEALERRRPLMQAWADHCDTPMVPATVTPIKAVRKRRAAA